MRGGDLPPHRREFPCPTGRFPQPLLYKETVGSPQFPSYPCECMPCSKTPVVSWLLAIFAPGLLSSGTWTPSTLVHLWWTYPSDHNHLVFRGSITQPAPSLCPAPDSSYEVCPWASLLACRLSFGQVGLFRLCRIHPLGNNVKFHPDYTGIPTTRTSLGTTMHTTGNIGS